MNEPPQNIQQQIIDIYRKRAKGYDQSPTSSFMRWRTEAVKTLELKPGDTVVDIGCGTGLNFSLLHQYIGPQGRIIGVDLTDAMLDQARLRIAEQGWQNVELVQSDAARYEYPARVDGIIATFALTFVPEVAVVINSGSQALAPGRKWVVLDMAWPAGWPHWLQHGLFFLPRYGITPTVVVRQPWQAVWKTLGSRLVEVKTKQFWAGFFYLSSGRKPIDLDKV